MSDTLASLRRKIDGAGDLEAVVRSMKALAAASIGQYERSVAALADYYRTVELGLAVCIKVVGTLRVPSEPAAMHATVTAIVFGSDQGLVGQFNEVLADFAVKALAALPGEKSVWAVGERMPLAAGGHRSNAGGASRRTDFRQRHHAARRPDSH